MQAQKNGCVVVMIDLNRGLCIGWPRSTVSIKAQAIPGTKYRVLLLLPLRSAATLLY